MRSTTLGFALALLLAPSAAFAAETKGETGGKGGNGPAAAPASESSAAGDVVGSEAAERRSANPDVTAHKVEESKAWEVGVSWETHRMIRQDDLEGFGAEKVFNVFGAYARYDLTEHDRISVRDYFQQEFITDQGESGLRSSDVTATYTRTVPLPRQFTFAASGTLTLPTSFQAQKSSLITAPTLVLQLDKRIGKYVSVTARTVGSTFFYKYAEAEGGLVNPKWHLSGTLEAEVTMPFHEPLSVGVDIATGYSWYYDPQGTTALGVVQDGQFPNGQPVQQSYGGEILRPLHPPQPRRHEERRLPRPRRRRPLTRMELRPPRRRQRVLPLLPTDRRGLRKHQRPLLVDAVKSPLAASAGPVPVAPLATRSSDFDGPASPSRASMHA